MSSEQQTPDVDRLVRSMLLLHGVHDDDAPDHHAPGHHGPDDDRPDDDGPDDDHRGEGDRPGGSWSKAADLTADRASALREATRRDRDRYLTSGLVSVDCRFCHVTVLVKKLGPAHTSVQWNSEAAQQCAHFTEIRDSGGDPARTPSCPKLSDSIKHAVAEGLLDEVSTAPSPGDG